MARLYGDDDRYAVAPASVLVEAVHAQVRDLVRQRLQDSGGDWEAFVFEASDRLINLPDFAAIEQRVLDTGYRFAASAMISAAERPDAYQPMAGLGDDNATFSFEHADAAIAPPDETGREQRGSGDNVVRRAANTVGVARYVRSSDQVIALMREGVPPGTIAIIDDAGGTLTAPVLEHFVGVICAGGTVRSHLGILTREYGIPCLMGARLSGIRDGDRVELESSAAARTAEEYMKGGGVAARIWKLP